MNCNYCGQDVYERGKCVGCGARSQTAVAPLVTSERRDPFFYNGYIIWPIRDYSIDNITFQFWQGDRHLEDITFSWDLWRNLIGPDSPTTSLRSDPFKYVWQLFEIAQGHKDLIVIQEPNKRHPAMFVTTRLEHPMRSFTWEQVVEEYKMQGGDLLR